MSRFEYYLDLFGWKTIPGFPCHRINKFGMVQSCLRHGGAARLGLLGPWHILLPQIKKVDGRSRYQLRGYGRLRQFFGGHLVLLSFVGPPPAGHETCHENGDCTNDCLDNLYWGTKKQNTEDKISHGTISKGSRHGMSKLTEAAIPIILQQRADGWTQEKIAKFHGVVETTIGWVLKGGTWKHCTGNTAHESI